MQWGRTSELKLIETPYLKMLHLISKYLLNYGHADICYQRPNKHEVY